MRPSADSPCEMEASGEGRFKCARASLYSLIFECLSMHDAEVAGDTRFGLVGKADIHVQCGRVVRNRMLHDQKRSNTNLTEEERGTNQLVLSASALMRTKLSLHFVTFKIKYFILQTL